METASRLCLDPEILAAYFDQGLGADENERVEAHLASCDRCRVIVARVLDTQSAVQEAGPAAPVLPSSDAPARGARFTRAQIVWGAGSLLAAAAVLAMMINVGTGSRLADLAAAVGDERPIEARLTGGFRHGPLRPPVRSGGSSAASDDWTLYAAAGRIREDADRDPSARNLHALGVAYLVLGQYDEAVRALEDAIAEDAEQARYQSDLSAAYLARAKELDRPDDLPRALGAAERAVKISDSLLEARFNRALALEALFLNDQARQAWEEYIARDGSSGWSTDARAHLQKLQRSLPPQGGTARNNSPPPLTETSVEAGLDWLLRYGLPSWAAAILANDSEKAAAEHLTLSRYAEQLSALSRDPFAPLLLNAADAPQMPDIGAALVRVESEEVAAAEALLRPACAKVRGVLALLCDLELATFDVLRRDDPAANRHLERVLASPLASESAYINGRAEKLAGYRRLFLGDQASALQHYLRAAGLFREAKYLRQASFMAIQCAELFDLTGTSQEGSRWRSASLALAATVGVPSLDYTVRLSTGHTLNQRGEHEAALVFARGAGNVPTPVPPLKRAILDLTIARTLFASGDVENAKASLSAAHAIITTGNDFRFARLKPEVLALQAQIEQHEGRTETAQKSLEMALALMGPERIAKRATALLMRADMNAAHPDRQAAALRDVHEVIALLKARVATPLAEPLHLDEAQAAFTAASALISNTSALQGSTGLLLIEQLLELINGVPANHQPFDEQNLPLPARGDQRGELIVQFLLRNDVLQTWTVTADGVRFFKRTLPSVAVQQLVNELGVHVRRNPANHDAWQQSLSELYDLLFAAVPGVAEASELTVIADGVLSQVPFAALFDKGSGRFVFEKAVVRIAPNLAFATRNVYSASPSAPVSAAAIGDPSLLGNGAQSFRRLPHARTETLAVAALYPRSQVAVGSDATKERALDLMARADVVHFAGHAVTTSGAGGARLLLAGDVTNPATALNADDLRARISRPTTVVLAACESAASAREYTTGVSGLSTAFLRAGAASVVATLWKIDDTASEFFFLNVHRGLAAGHSPAESVARAQRACRADQQCRAAVTTWIGTHVYGSN